MVLPSPRKMGADAGQVAQGAAVDLFLLNFINFLADFDITHFALLPFNFVVCL
jgi:hypothetical protein